MKKTFIIILTALTICSLKAQEIKLAKPTITQYLWQEQERIMFVHFCPATWQGLEYDNLSTPLSRINPTELSTDQWCKTALAWGAKQIIFVAKHTGGFCWWQTETTKYSVRNTPYKDGKGDVMKEISESCKKYGLMLGIYLSPQDQYNGAELGGKTKDAAKQETYNKIYRQQLTELLSKYGTITEVWFDGSCVVDVNDILDKYAKQAVIFQGPKATIRWPGTESGILSYPAWNSIKGTDLRSGVSTQMYSNPDGDAWAPLESDTPLYDHYWFWSPDGMKKRKSLAQLIVSYYKSVGYGAVMLLNSTPDTTGLIPKEDVERYKEFGNEIDRRFDKPIAEINNKEGNIQTIAFNKPTLINHIVTMEDYKNGERIREYTIEGLVDGNWKELVNGISIGHKKIDYFKEVTVSSLRLTVTKSVGTPLIRSLKAYYVGGFYGFKGSYSTSTWELFKEWQSTKEMPAEITLDLTKKINEPGQYFVKVETDNPNDKIKIENVELYYEGTRALDDYIKIDNNQININRTAQVTVESSSVIKFKIKTIGASKGTILFRPAMVFKAETPEFKVKYNEADKSMSVSLTTELDADSKVYYTDNGSIPDDKSNQFTKDIKLRVPSHFKAILIYKGKLKSNLVTYDFGLTIGKTVKLKQQPSDKYKANGASSLTDGTLGKTNFAEGNWLGFEGDNLDAVVDLGTSLVVRKVSLSYLVNTEVWIFEPLEIIVETSEDGTAFKQVASIRFDKNNWKTEPGIKHFSKDIVRTNARYIRYFVKNRGLCPDEHPGKGNKGWIFIDEVSAE